MDEQAARFGEAVRRGDAADLAELYAEQAVLLVPAMAPVYGRQAIQAFWLSGIHMGLQGVRFRSEGWNRAAELCCEVGTFTVTMTHEDGPITRGVYAVIRRLGRAGEWKWLVHLMSSHADWNHFRTVPTQEARKGGHGRYSAS